MAAHYTPRLIDGAEKDAVALTPSVGVWGDLQQAEGFLRLRQSIAASLARALKKAQGKVNNFDKSLRDAEGSHATTRKAEIITANLYRRGHAGRACHCNV